MDNFSPQALKQQNTYGGAFIDRAKGLLGGGMVGQAASTMQSQPYMMHVQEAQAQGVKPMTPEEFQMFMQSQRPPSLLGR